MDTVNERGDDAMREGRRFIRAAGLQAAISLGAIIFAAAYRAGFGETPSTTLRRVPETRFLCP